MRGPKMIVSDLDGTLFNGSGILSPLTTQTLKTLTDQGVQLVLATGRHHRDVHSIFAHTDLTYSLISSNGVRAYDETGHRLVAYNLTKRQISRILAIASTCPGIHLNVYTESSWNLMEPFPYAEERIRQGRLRARTRTRHKLSQLPGIKVFLYGSPEILAVCAEKLNRYPDLGVDLTHSTEFTLEAMPRGASKGTALSILLKHKNLTPADVIAFGDAMNDYEMLKLAGTGVVMSNAMEMLKEALPDAPRAQPNIEDGVPRYLRTLYGLE